jgi:hypothetical protein
VKTFFVAIGLCLFAASAHAESMALVGAFVPVMHDGDLSTTPSGLVFAATGGEGAGVEVRWAADSTYKWLTTDFVQIAPAPHRGKSFQPFGAIGPGVVFSGGSHSVGINFAGGVAVFFGDHAGIAIDYRYFRGRGTINGIDPIARTVSFGANWRF